MLQLRSLIHRLGDEAGEGVISSAIAVLITAFLGAAMWLVFNNLVSSAGESTCEQVSTIGGGAGTDCDSPAPASS